MRIVIADMANQVALCYQCGKRMHGSEEVIHADLDGPAYRAYYCVGCTRTFTSSGTSEDRPCPPNRTALFCPKDCPHIIHREPCGNGCRFSPKAEATA